MITNYKLLYGLLYYLLQVDSGHVRMDQWILPYLGVHFVCVKRSNSRQVSFECRNESIFSTLS